MESRSLPCIFLGYALNSKGYRCLHLSTDKIYINRNVQFVEHSFPFRDTTAPAIFPLPQEIPQSMALPILQNPSAASIQGAVPPDRLSARPTNGHEDLNIPAPTPDRSSSSHPEVATHVPPSSLPVQASSTAPPPSAHSMVTRTRDHTRRVRVFPDHVALLTALDSEPTSFTQANSLPEWRSAMEVEIDALARNNTWTLVPPPTDQQIIGSKWVYKLKRRSDGTLDRHKARLVAKGFHQEEGVDFFDTFSPVIRPTTIRILLSIAVTQHWPIQQLDVQNAFLHGDLTERVYMQQPPGFVDSNHPDHVCLLSKSLYGLKQAPRAWFNKLSTALIELGFHASNYDPSLFLQHSNGHVLYILVYVDDILVTGNNQDSIGNFIKLLQDRFAVKDLGKLHFFLGIEANFTEQGLYLNQSKYIRNLLSRANMGNARPVATPISTGTPLSKNDSTVFEDPHLYRSIVGALQYAMLTRPDISFAVNKVSQYMHEPTANHWAAIKRILRYLSGTSSHGLFITSQSSLDIHAYSDADWAGCVDDRRSTTGCCVFLGRNIVSWSAKKQSTISRSSTEAEYRSLAITCTELLCIQFLLKELHVPITQPPTLWCDNIGATFLAANPMFHARTKHIEINYHFVREKIVSKELCVRFLCSADQIADIMTKPLPPTRFNHLRSKLNVSLDTLACGGRVNVQNYDTTRHTKSQLQEPQINADIDPTDTVTES